MALSLSITTNVDGLKRKLDLLVENVRDLDKPLKGFGQYLRGKSQDRFDNQGPGWPELAESTQERRKGMTAAIAGQAKTKAEARLGRKVQREMKRAKQRREKGKGTEAAVERRYLALKEFERLLSGGSSSISLTGDKRGMKRVAKLLERLGRAQERAEGKLLGKLASSLNVSVSKGRLVVRSKVPWAGVHNEGGPAGHGAKVPARPFLFLEASDLEYLQVLLKKWLIKGL